jgi:hypothetical protein
MCCGTAAVVEGSSQPINKTASRGARPMLADTTDFGPLTSDFCFSNRAAERRPASRCKSSPSGPASCCYAAGYYPPRWLH